MKQIISNLILLLSFLLGIFHHEIIYSFHHSNHHIESVSIENHKNHSHHNHNDVLHDLESHDPYTPNRSNKQESKKKLKEIWNNFVSILDLFKTSLIPERNLLKITSPPYYFRHIKNYSYSDNIRIIKSNT